MLSTKQRKKKRIYHPHSGLTNIMRAHSAPSFLYIYTVLSAIAPRRAYMYVYIYTYIYTEWAHIFADRENAGGSPAFSHVPRDLNSRMPATVRTSTKAKAFT